MTEEKMRPLRQRIIEDMRLRGMGDRHQKSHIRAIMDFTAFLGHSPDTATTEELRAYRLHMTDSGVRPSTFNTRIVVLRFFFGVTCGRQEMKRYRRFRTKPRKLPVVFSVEEVSDILMAAPGPGLKYRAALSIFYGAGLRARSPLDRALRLRGHDLPAKPLIFSPQAPAQPRPSRGLLVGKKAAVQPILAA
jgi:integrase/recombinase XerD